MSASVRSASTATAHGEPITIARPSGVQAGDLLVAIYFGDLGLSGVTSSGWTASGSRADGDQSCRVLRKTATGGESSSYTFGQPINADGTLHLICVKDADTAAAPNIQFAVNFAETVITPSVTPASSSTLEIRAGGLSPFPGTLTLSAPSGYTMRGTVAAPGGFMTSAIATRQINSSTATGLKSFAFAPAEVRFGIGVSISIASADTGPPVEPPPPLTPGKGTSLYRYVLRDWDGTYLDDLPFVGVSFDKRIGQSGTFAATIPIPSSRVAQRIARVIPRDTSQLGIGPGVITCEIYRDGDPWGEYWITGAQISRSRRGTPSISLRGSTMDAYLMQVELQEELEYLSEDQLDIARALIAHMQGQPHADLRLIPQAGTSGVTRDFLYKADEATYGTRLTELALLDDGFEWTVDVVAGASGLERHWVWGYPKLGGATVEHVFVDSPHGGDILEWSEEVDALRGATSWRARGGTDPAQAADASTETTSLISAPHEATAHLAAGWPLITRTLNYSSVTDVQALEDFAAYWAAAAGGALRVDSVTVALGAQPTFTPTSLGDQARIYLNNEWHLPQSRVRRIIGVGITPISRETGKEEATLVFEGLEVPGG